MMKTLLRLRIFMASFVLVVIFAGNVFSGGNQKKVDPFSINVKALQGQNAVDVYATFITSDPIHYPLPPSIKKFQIKIFRKKRRVEFVSNEKRLALIGNQIVSTIPGRFDNDTLRVLADIKTPQKGDVELDKEWARVKLRPDLKVASIQAPSQQNVNLPFAVEVLVQEINMQTPATCAVSLYREGSLVHTTTNVAVAAGGNVSVIFGGLSYASAGVENYSVVISDVEPGDYNNANNTGTFSTTFVSPISLDQSNYQLEYTRINSLSEDHARVASNGSPVYESHYEVNQETFNYQIYNDNPPAINDGPVSASYKISLSDNSVMRDSFINLAPSYSDEFYTMYEGWDAVNSISFTALKNNSTNAVSSSIQRPLSNTIYFYNDRTGSSDYFSSGAPTSSFLNENTGLTVSLVTSFGDYTFGGGASIGISPGDISNTSSYDSVQYYDEYWEEELISIQQTSSQLVTKNVAGLTDVAILPGASHRNEAKITIASDDRGLPKEFRLNQNYPNPFNPSTIISYALPRNAFVSVKVYDMLGREVKTLLSDEMAAGIHTVEWKGDENGGGRASSGTYLFRIAADNFVSTKKMILIK